MKTPNFPSCVVQIRSQQIQDGGSRHLEISESHKISKISLHEIWHGPVSVLGSKIFYDFKNIRCRTATILARSPDVARMADRTAPVVKVT